jgi:cell division protease FtsH
MTTGAGNDIERVSDLARKMVCEWGMSEAVGPLTFRAANPLSSQPAQILSEHTALLIDAEVKKLVQSAYDTARAVVVDHQGVLEALTRALVENETINRTDIQAIVDQAGDR